MLASLHSSLSCRLGLHSGLVGLTPWVCSLASSCLLGISKSGHLGSKLGTMPPVNCGERRHVSGLVSGKEIPAGSLAFAFAGSFAFAVGSCRPPWPSRSHLEWLEFPRFWSCVRGKAPLRAFCTKRRHTTKRRPLAVDGRRFLGQLHVFLTEKPVGLGYRGWYAASFALLHDFGLGQGRVGPQLLAQGQHFLGGVPERAVQRRVHSQNVQELLLHGLQGPVVAGLAVLPVIVLLAAALQVAPGRHLVQKVFRV
jgi:hypothetical protein